MAAVSWKNLTQEQRQGYIQMFHANEEDPALDILPEPLPGVNNESRAERVSTPVHQPSGSWGDTQSLSLLCRILHDMLDSGPDLRKCNAQSVCISDKI